MNKKIKSDSEDKKSTYTIEDAMKVTNEIFKLNKKNEYNPGAFIHGLIFALEVTQQNYKIPQQQIAQIRRGCRKYFSEIIENDINRK
jgi:hypothetical protein